MGLFSITKLCFAVDATWQTAVHIVSPMLPEIHVGDESHRDENLSSLECWNM